MAKVSPVSIKYMIHANLTAEGALEKPDVIGAVFGQTEGLLGADLELRELQKEGKIGRIEVDLERKDKMTTGVIKIPTAVDQSETTLIAAAIETIERVGPCDAQIEIVRIEDVRGSKRDYIIERAKKLMMQVQGSTDSREISNTVKDSTKTNDIAEFGEDKVPCGDLSGNEIIVVEGRADVMNLMRSGIKNVVAMNGTKLPRGIKELSQTKEITLFVDGDRGGKLIAQNVCDNARVKYIAMAPDGKEVEELTGKEVLMNLRKKVPADDFFRRGYRPNFEEAIEPEVEPEKMGLTDEEKAKLKTMSDEVEGSGKAILLDDNLEEMKTVSAKLIPSNLRRLTDKPSIIVMDGIVTSAIIEAAEECMCQIIVAKNFAATTDKIKLLSL